MSDESSALLSLVSVTELLLCAALVGSAGDPLSCLCGGHGDIVELLLEHGSLVDPVDDVSGPC